MYLHFSMDKYDDDDDDDDDDDYEFDLNAPNTQAGERRSALLSSSLPGYLSYIHTLTIVLPPLSQPRYKIEKPIVVLEKANWAHSLLQIAI